MPSTVVMKNSNSSEVMVSTLTVPMEPVPQANFSFWLSL